MRAMGLKAVALLVAALIPAPLAAEQAGITGAVNVEALGTPPGGIEQVLAIGGEIVRDERVVTNRQGLAQLIFLDQTTLTVGPNSDIVIDEFVYDPSTREGDLLMSASVGVFRLIGGDVSEGGGITVTTPLATIGIRGSNVLIEIKPGGGSVRITCSYCEEVTVQSKTGKTATIHGNDRFRTLEVGPDGRISDPFALTDEELKALQLALSGNPPQTGGILTPPTQELAENNAPKGNSDKPAGNNLPGQPPEVEEGYNSGQLPLEEVVEDATTDQQQDEIRQEAIDNAEPPPPPPTDLLAGVRWISSNGTSGNGWTGGKQDPAFTQTGTAGTVTSGFVTYQLSGGGTLTLPYPGGQSQAAFPDTGTTSPNGAVSGSYEIAETAEGIIFYYQLVETASDARAIVFGGTPADLAAAIPTVAAFNVFQDPIGGQGDQLAELPFTLPAFYAGIDPSVIATSPLYFVSDGGANPQDGEWGLAALGIQGSGPEQQTVLLVASLEGTSSSTGAPALGGHMTAFTSHGSLAHGNLSTIPDGNGTGLFGNDQRVDGFLSAPGWDPEQGDETLHQRLGIPGPSQDTDGYVTINQISNGGTSVPEGLGEDRPTVTHEGFAAGMGIRTPEIGTLSPDSEFYPVSGTMTLSLGPSGGGATMNLSENYYYGDQVQMTFGDLAYIDRQNFTMQKAGDGQSWVNGVAAAREQSALVTYQMVAQGATSLINPADVCECAFMEWGFWAHEQENPGSGESLGRLDTFTLGTWVAGNIIGSEEDLPFSGTASYEGHAIANIISNADGPVAQYLASGALNATVDFGYRDLYGNITNLDGRDYSFSTDSEGGGFGTGFYAYGSSSDQDVYLQMNGAFFTSPASNVAGIGGAFTLEGGGEGAIYAGSGTFMGECTDGVCTGD